MYICRLFFRKATGRLLLRVVYDTDEAPSIEQELEDFAALNGYNEDALEIISLSETDKEFENATIAETIRLEDGSLIYTFTPKEPGIQQEPSPIEVLNDKVGLLIQMQLEREGIV